MQITDSFFGNGQSLTKFFVACLLIFVIGLTSFGQYRGAPVKKDRLLKALRSKQLQTADIVAVINTNGVDFRLTPDLRKTLVAAGARPEVIRAIENNRRQSQTNNTVFARNDFKNTIIDEKPQSVTYDDLLENAIRSFKEQKNPKGAVSFLKAAINMKPASSEAYQMMGFVNLYGLNNKDEAQKYMQEAIAKGGSAVFRVYHNDNGKFTNHCTGSLYVSPERVRFESDDNLHTFETSMKNVSGIKTYRGNAKAGKNKPVFRILLQPGKGKTKLTFSPLTGKDEELNLAALIINESKENCVKNSILAVR